MTLSEIGSQRLVNQQVTGTKIKTAPEMVAWFGAIQGQEYEQTKWSLGLRLPLLRNADIEKDLSAGRILRTHVLRPTWHFVAAEDIKWLLKLTAPRVNAANAFMYRQLELDDKLFKRSNAIIEKLLRDGNQLTRNAINLGFKKSKIEAEGHRLSYIMMRAELDGIICSGARQGSQFTYALLDERIPSAKEKTNEDALAELTLRYFLSRGPATLKDFSTWSGLTLASCRKGVEMIGAQFRREIVGDETYYLLDSGQKKQKSMTMQMLPIYDELIMGYKKRDALFTLVKTLKSKPIFRYDCTLVFDGQVVGTWRRTLKPTHCDVEYDFFRPPDKIQKEEFGNAILGFKYFLGLDVLV